MPPAVPTVTRRVEEHRHLDDAARPVGVAARPTAPPENDRLLSTGTGRRGAVHGQVVKVVERLCSPTPLTGTHCRRRPRSSRPAAPGLRRSRAFSPSSSGRHPVLEHQRVRAGPAHVERASCSWLALLPLMMLQLDPPGRPVTNTRSENGHRVAHGLADPHRGARRLVADRLACHERPHRVHLARGVHREPAVGKRRVVAPLASLMVPPPSCDRHPRHPYPVGVGSRPTPPCSGRSAACCPSPRCTPPGACSPPP